MYTHNLNIIKRTKEGAYGRESPLLLKHFIEQIDLIIRLDPINIGRSPLNKFASLTEPQTNLLFGRFKRIGTVNDVTANGDLYYKIIINFYYY